MHHHLTSVDKPVLWSVIIIKTSNSPVVLPEEAIWVSGLRLIADIGSMGVIMGSFIVGHSWSGVI